MGEATAAAGSGTDSTQAGSNGSQPPGGTPAAEGGTPETFDGWLGKQEANVKALVDAHVGGLKSALETERNDRKSITAQLKALQAEGDPARQKQQIAELQASLAEQAARNKFAEEAVSQGVTNIRLAYLAAKDGGLVGKADCWEKLKQQTPELFRKTAPTVGNAGTGSGAHPTSAPTMNQLLRGR